MEVGTQVLIARNRPRLEGRTRFPFASADLAMRIQDKGELTSFASAHGVECPATFRPEGPEDVHGMASLLPYPLLIKPRLSSGGRGILRVESPGGGGPSTLRESVRDETLCRTTERLLSALGWTGVAMAEFKVDPRDGRPKPLEVNPRVWGSLHHALLSGG